MADPHRRKRMEGGFVDVTFPVSSHPSTPTGGGVSLSQILSLPSSSGSSSGGSGSMQSVGTEVSLPDLVPEDTAVDLESAAELARQEDSSANNTSADPGSTSYKYCNDAFRKLNEKNAATTAASATAAASESAKDSTAGASAGAASFEHTLEPGDHVYRWSHFAYSYPIQIHGIVLSTEGGAKRGNNDEDDEKTEDNDENKKSDGDKDGEHGGEEKKDNAAENDAAGGGGGGGGETPFKNDPPNPSASSGGSNGEEGPRRVSVTIADFGFTRKGGDDDETENGGVGVEAAEEQTGEDGNNTDCWDASVPSAAAAATETGNSNKDGSGKDGTKSKRQQPQMNKNESFIDKLKDGRRLNVITLTDEKDIKKWKKVNWEESIFSSGGGKGGKKKRWGSLFKGPKAPSVSSMSGRCGSNATKACDDSTVDVNVATVAGIDVVVEETEEKEEGEGGGASAGQSSGDTGSGNGNTEAKAEAVVTTSSEGEQQGQEQQGPGALSAETTTTASSTQQVESKADGNNNDEGRPPSPNERRPKSPPSTAAATAPSTPTPPPRPSSSPPPPFPIKATPVDLIPSMEEGTEAKTLEEMIAAANAVERRARTSPRKSASSPLSERNPASVQSAAHIRKSGSLANIWPWKGGGGGGGGGSSDVPSASQNDRGVGDASASASAAVAASQTKQGGGEKQQQQQEPQKLPKSDPSGIVLARVTFLLEHEADGILPPYHVFNSNSECIAVWCKTGRWSSLQSDVFLHTSGIGNAKSSTVMGLTLAATQPWLIPAIPIAAVAAVGAPYLVLHQAKKKGAEATQNLNDGFWAWAGPEVYVEAIRNWSGLR